jgi:hypothetical protein
MKGVIFVMFEEFITENWGADTYEDILDECPHVAEVAFIGPKTYPDQWVIDLLQTACARLEVEAPAALRAFGKFAFHGLTTRYPIFLKGVDHPRQLLLAVHDIIHVEVKKLMEGATPPDLFYEGIDGPKDRLTVHYESTRGLCPLMEGLLDGAADYFGVPVEYQQSACTHKGDKRCTFQIRFPEPANS